jgi:uncharacterized protein YqeY
VKLQETFERDLKTALLAGEKAKVETLKSIKNALQYEAVAQKLKPEELTEQQVQQVLARELKKRHEAAEMYQKAGANDRAQAEMQEKLIIETYLPPQLAETEVEAVVKEEIAKLGSPTPADMGKIIGTVRTRLLSQADGATIARLVKQNLEPK